MSTLTSSSYQSGQHQNNRYSSRHPHHLLCESSSSSSAHGRRQQNINSSYNVGSRHRNSGLMSENNNHRHCSECPTTTQLTRYPMPDLTCEPTRNGIRHSADLPNLTQANTRIHSSVTPGHFHSSHIPTVHSHHSSHPRHTERSSPPAPLPPYTSLYSLKKKTPKRYFNLGLFCCCTAGFVFTFGLVLMVWGSSPHEPNAIWISGIVFLFAGGFLFFLGIGSIGLYLSREDARKKKEELERTRARQYAASLSSVRSLTRSSDIYLID